MKRKQLIILLLFVYSTIYSQKGIFEADTISKQIDRNNITNYIFGTNPQSIKVKIDENNNLIFSKTIEGLDLNKEDIYNRALSYFIYNYKDAKSVIQQQDKNAGIIIGKGYFADFHSSIDTYDANGMNFITKENYSAEHLLRIDIKEGRARIILTLYNYEITKTVHVSNFITSAIASPNKVVSKRIVECAPLDTTSVSSKIYILTGEKLVSSKVRKFYEKQVQKTITSEFKAFIPICKRSENSIIGMEKVLKGGNTSKENDNW